MEKQLEFEKINGWGGQRAKSGRKNKTGEVNHMARAEVSIKHPLHITLRLRQNLPSLRKARLFKEFKKCVLGAKKFNLYILQFSVQSTHIHLFAEAKDNESLARGMQALAGRLAKIIKKFASMKAEMRAMSLGEANRGEAGLSSIEMRTKDGATKARRATKGNSNSVFNGRYHLHVLITPREVKNALEYVLLNLSKHQKVIEYIDHFSSGARFQISQWKKLLGNRFRAMIKFDAETWHDERERENGTEQNGARGKIPARNLNLELLDILSEPKSWLAEKGWHLACA